MVRHLIYYMTLLAALLLTAACADNDANNSEETLPEGMGRIRITITAPENATTTRAVRQPNAWEDPDHDWERLQTFRILICNTNYQVVQIIEGTDEDFTEQDHTGDSATDTDSESSTHKAATVTSDPLTAGNYYIFATANYADGYVVGSTIDPDATAKFPAFNGYSETDIPMTGKLMNNDGTLKPVGVSNGVETDAGTLALWRVVGKLSFEFTNETSEQVQILGIEVDPINQASTTGPGIYLFSKDNLESEDNLSPYNHSNTDQEASVTATWPLHDASTIALPDNVNANVSVADVLDQAQMTSNLSATGQVTAEDAYHSTLQKFMVTTKTTSRNDNAVITLTVKPKSGFTFKPTRLLFTASRVGTDGGNFDVVTESGSTTTVVATGEQPARYNGTKGSHEPPFITAYDYNLTSAATEGIFTVKIYPYNLENKEFAFSDVVISGIVKSTETVTREMITLPEGARTDVGPVNYTPVSEQQTVASNGGTRSLFFYVNETDASFTTINNQLSIRLKIRRGSHEEELRYGMTTHHDLTTNGVYGGSKGGFNVIRRNDWIHIPIHLTDWQFRVEPLAFVPIAGYPAATLSSDALTTTFSTGGPIILQPFAQKSNDGMWRDFTDPEVTFVSLTWKNSDGTNVAGTGKIFETAPAYDATTGRIVGILNNNLPAGIYKTSVTINVKLGPQGGPQYDHAFTFNVVLQK